MNAIKLLMLGLVIVSSFSCKKEDNDSVKKDTTKPVITLNGDADMSVPLGSNTSDPGATATDDVDGNISSAVSSNWSSVDQNKTGNYTVTYNVSDKAGNAASVTRKVTVKMSGSGLSGLYNTIVKTPSGTSQVFTSTISPGSNANQINVYPFHALNINLRADLTGALFDQLTFNHNEQGINVTGSGAISNFGKNIELTGTLSSTSGSQTFTQTMTRQ